MRHLNRPAIPWCVGFALFTAFFAIATADCAQTPSVGEKIVKPTETESRLQSLRRSVESATDIKVVLDRYARFSEQYKDSPVVKDAATDMATWKDRQEKGMAKVGSRWVTPAERAAMKAKAGVIAIGARDAMIQSNLPEAGALVRRALDEDPANVGATYLNGLLLYGQNQKQLAKKCFETVAAAVPLEGPTLNNLAVLQWDPEQPAMAMKRYEQAMMASKLNPAILRNVAEAIHVMPVNQKATLVTASAVRVYEAQQAQLAKKMEQDGQYPWGTRWVDQATLARLEAAEKQVKEKMAALSGEYDKLQIQVTDINKDVDANTKTMQLLQNATTYLDAKGVSHTRSLSPQYYVLQRQNETLATNRAPLQQKQNELRAQASATERELPMQKYTMMQTLIGPEGMPTPK